eukprot:5544269-Heterocapsa_arctica.AAC.1
MSRSMSRQEQFMNLRMLGAVAGPRERTVAAPEPAKNKSGYPQVAPTYVKRINGWDYTYVAQEKYGPLGNISSSDVSLPMKWRRGAKQALITTCM